MSKMLPNNKFIVKAKSFSKAFADDFLRRWKQNKKIILMNFLVLFSIMTLGIIFDQVTKSQIFVWNAQGNNGIMVDNNNYGWIGTRSFGNYGITSGITSSIPLIQTFSILAIIAIIISAYYSSHPLKMIGFSLIATGALGNAIDRFAFNGMVKDIIYIPWYKNGESGTFNIADVLVAIGSIVSVLTIVLSFMNIQRIKNQKAQEQILKKQSLEINTLENDKDQPNDEANLEEKALEKQDIENVNLDESNSKNQQIDNKEI
ncbi:signal peptidase II [Mycoplasmopsis pulmonis]|nr:signal peptidase II [Mycoplasmopsis pulmonis]